MMSSLVPSLDQTVDARTQSRARWMTSDAEPSAGPSLAGSHLPCLPGAAEASKVGIYPF
jgi:hypothetical protein